MSSAISDVLAVTVLVQHLHRTMLCTITSVVTVTDLQHTTTNQPPTNSFISMQLGRARCHIQAYLIKNQAYTADKNPYT